MELIYYVAASLDGFIATSDGGVDWLDEFNSGDDDYGYADFYASVDVLLMGGNTARQLLGFNTWPYPDKPVIVFTRQELDFPVDGLRVETRSPAEVLGELEREGHRRAWLVGGGELAAACLEEGLLTDLILTSMPVLLGSGVPLLKALSECRNLELEDSRCYSSGVIQSQYRVD